MFDCWPEEWPATPAHRTVVPPRPVTVDLVTAIARDRVPAGYSRPMRVKAGGLDLSGEVPGLLHAWARVNTGTWLALVELTVCTGNRRGRLELRHWVPASAVTPAPPSS